MKVSVTLEFNVVQCACCNIPFGVTADFENRRREDHKNFYCPAGHLNVFGAETEAERLRKNLHAKTLEAERVARELKASQEVAAKLALRAKHGVCPCCQRSFKALRAHMSRKHPDYAA